MGEKDYSQGEIDYMIGSLLTTHYGKLKAEELFFVRVAQAQSKPLTQEDRDTLIKLYDAIGESSYD